MQEHERKNKLNKYQAVKTLIFCIVKDEWKEIEV